MRRYRADIPTVVAYFIESSSNDMKGRRVLLRHVSGPENWLYSGELLDAVDRRLFDIGSTLAVQIADFLAG